MLQGFLAFAAYLGTAAVLLTLFIVGYVRLTPYHDFQQISEGNTAAGVTLAGAILGFTFPLVSSIYYTQSLLEMSIWALITGLVQFLLFLCIRRWMSHIRQGTIAPAIFVASLSIAIGLLNAVSISH